MLIQKLGSYEQRFFDPVLRPPANYTPPGQPSFVDIFKGKDDENYVQKTYLITKYSVFSTAIASLFDICVGTQPKDLVGCVKRIGYWGVPFIGGGLTYTTIVCASASLRKKDDQWNHFFGGAAVGGLIGALRKSHMTGFGMAFAIGMAGVFYKESVIQGWELLGNPRHQKRGFAMSHKCDYTVLRDIPGNWYTDPTPQPYPPVPPACK